MNYLDAVKQLSYDDVIVEFTKMYTEMTDRIVAQNMQIDYLERERIRLTLLLEGDNSIENSLKTNLD